MLFSHFPTSSYQSCSLDFSEHTVLHRLCQQITAEQNLLQIKERQGTLCKYIGQCRRGWLDSARTGSMCLVRPPNSAPGPQPPPIAHKQFGTKEDEGQHKRWRSRGFPCRYGCCTTRCRRKWKWDPRDQEPSEADYLVKRCWETSCLRPRGMDLLLQIYLSWSSCVFTLSIFNPFIFIY